MRTFLIATLVLFLLSSCKKEPLAITTNKIEIDTIQGVSLLNAPLIRRQVDIKKDSLALINYTNALENYNMDSLKANHIIWLGRRMAYLGDYKKAIEIFTKGTKVFEKDARFYRHRGHRYISTRQLDKAITDFEKASQLIHGKEDRIEPDGIPNRLNQPISSLHSNIYYHLGLAHYVKNDLAKALVAFDKSLDVSNNDDKQVSTRHWLYMIYRRLNKKNKADLVLEAVSKNMTIIENDAYHQLLLFYKGELTEADIKGTAASGSSEAVLYGLANWYHYNGDLEKAKELYRDLLKNGNWAGFGYLAAEADLSRLEIEN